MPKFIFPDNTILILGGYRYRAKLSTTENHLFSAQLRFIQLRNSGDIPTNLRQNGTILEEKFDIYTVRTLLQCPCWIKRSHKTPLCNKATCRLKRTLFTTEDNESVYGTSAWRHSTADADSPVLCYIPQYIVTSTSYR